MPSTEPLHASEIPMGRGRRIRLSRDGMLHMMFKLGQCAEKSWRKLRGFAHLADVIQDVDFVNGIKPSTQDQAAA